MHLINAHTLAVEDFVDDEIPRYATLSHRWLREEMTFQEMQAGAGRQKAGFDKVRRTCLQAVSDKIDYVWIDTCCIDKSSSAELSEAINSMFTWYYESLVCYVYLYDVDDVSNLSESAWFTRGFTLQELIAPPRLMLYSSAWKLLGIRTNPHLRDEADKSVPDLTELLCEITSIPRRAFHSEYYQYFSIAERMSWAADRRTTRKEDRAYSLMGIFGVNMPLLYGEGDKAFMRLQEEIIKQSDDQSIFVWAMPDESARGLLAPSPECFRRCGNIQKADGWIYQQPYSMTNKGLSIELHLAECLPGLFIAALAASILRDNGLKDRLGIFLRYDRELARYQRIQVNGKDVVVSGPSRMSDYDSFIHVDDIRPRQNSSISAVAALWSAEFSRDPKYPVTHRILSRQYDERYLGSLLRRVGTNTYMMSLERVDPWVATGTFRMQRDLEMLSQNIFHADKPLAKASSQPIVFLALLKAEPAPVLPPRPSSLFKINNRLVAERAPKIAIECAIIAHSGRLRVACRITDHYRGQPKASLKEITVAEIPHCMSDAAFVRDKDMAVGNSAGEDLWVMRGNHHVFLQVVFPRKGTLWNIDILYASPTAHRCSDCHKILSELRFQCMQCPMFHTCWVCLQDASSSHRYKESGGSSKHEFRALWPSGQDHWTMVSAITDQRIRSMKWPPVVLPGL